MSCILRVILVSLTRFQDLGRGHMHPFYFANQCTHKQCPSDKTKFSLMFLVMKCTYQSFSAKKAGTVIAQPSHRLA